MTLLTRPSTGDTTCWSFFRVGGKRYFLPPSQHFSRLWDVRKPFSKSPVPVVTWRDYFPILGNAASAFEHIERILGGFIGWWWWTRAYAGVSCFSAWTFLCLLALSTSLWQRRRDLYEWLQETTHFTHRLTFKPQKEVGVVWIWPNILLELVSEAE